MKRLLLLIVAGMLVISGCSSAPKKKVNVQLMKNDPPMGCRMVGDVEAKGDDMNEAKASLREQAAEKGGNYVRLDALTLAGGDAVAAGAAFKCQPAGGPSEPSEAKPE